MRGTRWIAAVVWSASAVSSVVVLVLHGPGEVLGALALLALAADAFVVARYTGTPWAVAAGAVFVVASQWGAGNDDEVPILFAALGPLVAGMAIRSRDLVARQLDERAAELEAEREIYSELSVRYERTRLASELHDIVAHAMSVMVVQAGAGQRLAGVDADLTAEAFVAIAESARQAEADMHRLVELLSDESADRSPDLGVVEELVQRAAGGGLDVTLRLEGSRDGLPASAVEIAYAVVRESLTNALRYAAGAAVQVRVDGGAQELVVDVVNAPAPHAPALVGHGTGSGLGGLRERVAQAEGRFIAGPTDGGGWQVTARVPRVAGSAKVG